VNLLDDFADFCSELVLDNGATMTLEPFQRKVLTDYFEGVRETLILIPKKQGKTTLLAAIALWHLLTTPDAECVVAAASRDQATILFDQAAGFVRRTPDLAEQVSVKRGYRELRVPDGSGRVRVLAADVDTADGVLPSLALVDELHRHKSADLYGIFRDGLGPRDGRMLTISTAGDDESSPLGELRKGAHALRGFTKDGAYGHVRTSGFAWHEWALDPDQDRENLALVKGANPASWQTIEALRERHDSPSMTPWAWARFACGVWMAGEESAISEREWRACADAETTIPDGSEGVLVGIDLGWKHDYTALVPICRPGGGDVALVHPPTILIPPGDGVAIDAEDIFAVVEQMAEKWPQVVFVLDPEAGGEQLAQRIDRELQGRALVATHSQKTTAMCTAAQRLSEAISAKRIQHPDDAELTRHVLNAAAQQVGAAWKFVKRRKKGGKIDALVALAMAHSVLIAGPPKPKGKGIWFA